MNLNIAVAVVEEIIEGNRLLFIERKDLRFNVKGSSFTEAKAVAKKKFSVHGYQIISIGYSTTNTMRVIFRQTFKVTPPRPGVVYRSAAGDRQPVIRTTASGRVR